MGELQGACIVGFEIPEAQKGSLDAEQYDRVARDITTFLAYVGEPAALKRESIGAWVVLFLAPRCRWCFMTARSTLSGLRSLRFWRSAPCIST